MIRIAFFILLLVSVVALAWVRGRQDERIAALTCLLGTILTHLAGQSLATPFVTFDLAACLVDVGVLLAFLFIALRSSRYWPLWAAGLQLTATTVHLLKLINPDLLSFVFGAALAFWSYPILIVIALGAWRTDAIERWRRELHLREYA